MDVTPVKGDNMKKNTGWYLAGALLLAMVARAGVIVYDSVLVNETALAHNATYSLDMQANGINALSAQALFSSATPTNVPFQDGSQATGSFTVTSFASLSAKAATNNITVTSTSSLSGASIVLPGYVFLNGLDWATGATPAATAISIKNALSTVPWLRVSASGSVVYATATVGAFYNTMQMVSSNGNIVVASSHFTGGQNNATVAINGVVLAQGLNWTAATSNNATAASLASAINASTALNTKIGALASGAVVTLTSKFADSLYNYSLVSSTPSGLAASGVNMTAGTAPAFRLGSTLFAVPANGLSLALPVLFTGSPAIGGLASGSTYYAVPVDANDFMLAKYSTSAVAGVDLVVITSTNTRASADSYLLAPLGIGGVPSFKWQVSNDNSTWSDLAVSSVTMGPTGTAYAQPPSIVFWSFGFIGTRYIRLNVVAPTAGGISLKVFTIGSN